MDGRFDIVTPTNVTYAKSLLLSNEGTSLDLTSWSGFGMKLRAAPGGTLLLALNATPTANGSVLAVAAPATLGILNLLIKPADLQALPVGMPNLASYDLVGADPSGIVRRLMWGSFITYPGDTF